METLEADALARHAELLGLGAAGSDELAGALAVAEGVAVEDCYARRFKRQLVAFPSCGWRQTAERDARTP